MRQVLLALVCLSTFALAQNVLAIAPLPASSKDLVRVAAGVAESGTGVGTSPVALESTPPELASLGLFGVGLGGLIAVGSRRRTDTDADARSVC
jgi:hypothetical protein